MLWHIRCSPHPTAGRSGPEPDDEEDDEGDDEDDDEEDDENDAWDDDDHGAIRWYDEADDGRSPTGGRSGPEPDDEDDDDKEDDEDDGEDDGKEDWGLIWEQNVWYFYHLVDTFNSNWQESFLESSSVKSALPWISNELHRGLISPLD